MSLTLLALGAAGASALGGAIGSAANTAKARKEHNAWYDRASAFANGLRYENLLETVSGRAAQKQRNEQRRDNIDALNNRAVAGGATYENQLAARQMENEADSRLTSQLLQSDEARRRAADQMQMNLDAQHSNFMQNSYMQNAQNWQAWGAQMGNAAMSLGSTSLLGNIAGVDMKTMLGLKG